jgi:ATP/maltotriose-dependent transcriptional regulator MalT
VGDSYLDVAQTLFITQNTVKTHVSALYRKLNVNRRSEALHRAWRLGLLNEVSPTVPTRGRAGAAPLRSNG